VSNPSLRNGAVGVSGIWGELEANIRKGTRMAKDAYYFPHDSNAKDDPKCVALIEQLGMEGYGIYWVLIETLRDQPDYRYPFALIGAIARRYNTQAQKVELVVRNYGLFVVDEQEFFLSDSLNRRMEKVDAMRQNAINAGKISAQKRLAMVVAKDATNGCSTGVQRAFNGRSTIKEKKRKENTTAQTQDAFARFWDVYPKRRDKAKAQKSFAKISPDDTLLGSIIAAVEKQKGSQQWQKEDGQFIPLPSTWLNNRRWEDEIKGDSEWI
jgi:hypothetical protein